MADPLLPPCLPSFLTSFQSVPTSFVSFSIITGGTTTVLPRLLILLLLK